VRHRCLSTCAETSISYRVADGAVLAELARLRGAPWQPQPLEAVCARDPYEAERRQLRMEVAAGEAEMDAHVRSFSLANVAGAPTHEEILAFRRRSQEISARISRAKEALAALPESRTNTVTAQQVYAALTQAEIPSVVASAQERNDTAPLRELLQLTVQEARIVERWPGGRRTTWARVAVVWTPDVQLLLETGCLALDAPPTPPTDQAAREKAAARARRYRERLKENTARAKG
jgi:hypothetical protein